MIHKRVMILILLFLFVGNSYALDLAACDGTILEGGISHYDLQATADKVDALRKSLKEVADADTIREELASIAIDVLEAAINAYSRGDSEQQHKLQDYYKKRLNDSLWRMGYWAKNDNQRASIASAWVYHWGLKAEVDTIKACEYYQHASHAIAAASFQYSLCLSVSQPELSIELLKMSAQSGDPVAQETIGRLCIEGQQQDKQCALEYFCLAARQGRSSSASLAGWIAMDQASAEAQKIARTYLEYASYKGNLAAQNNLGKFLELSQPEKAFQWYEKAAESGFAAAQLNIARAYAAGIGVVENKQQAILWAKKASDQGLKEAGQLLAWLER